LERLPVFPHNPHSRQARFLFMFDILTNRHSKRKQTLSIRGLNMFQRLIELTKRLSPSAVAYLSDLSDDEILEILLLIAEHGIDDAIDTVESHCQGLMM
jgi:hypothetical protein